MTEDRTVAKRTKGETGVATLALPTPGDMQAIKDALGPGESLSVDLLERAKWPTGGAQFFEIGTRAPAKEIEGVLISRQPVRVYWRVKYGSDGGGNPPDCYSMDNETGHGDNGEPGPVHDCQTCPLSEWGTATNDKGEPAAGKACRQVTRLFMVEGGNMLPMLVPVPPSSYKDAQTYVLRLASRRTPYHAVVTKIGLKQEKSKGGVTYSRATFETVRDLDDAERVQVQAYRDSILPFLNALSVVDVESRETA